MRACLGEGGEHLDGPVELQVAEVVLDLFVDAAHVGSPSLVAGQVGGGDVEVAAGQHEPTTGDAGGDAGSPTTWR